MHGTFASANERTNKVWGVRNLPAERKASPKTWHPEIKHTGIQTRVILGGLGIWQVMEFEAERQNRARAGGNLHAKSKIKCEIKFARSLNRNFIEEGQKAGRAAGEKLNSFCR